MNHWSGKTDKRADNSLISIICHNLKIARKRIQKFAKNAKGESKKEYFAKTNWGH